MIRWVAVIFLALTIFPILLPWLKKSGVGRAPGDFHVRVGGYDLCLPFGSTLALSVLAFGFAELMQHLVPFA